MDVKGKNIVVTGGGNGIGRALSQRFAKEGAGHVTVVDLDAGSAAEVAGAIGGTAHGVDVGNREAMVELARSVEQVQGPIDLFVSNAGIITPGSVEATVDSWQKIWDVNVMAHVHAAHAILPGMLERGEGAFLNTCSAAGLLTQIGSAPYSVTKHASVAFAEWLSITYGDQGIKVFALCPQAVNTAMTAGTEAGGVAGVDGMLEPTDIANAVIDGLAAESFLILPHPEVATYFQRKAGDYDRWIRGMRKLNAQFLPEMEKWVGR
ncbi:MAG: SDR family NAD(P)-dependent oxidoreductase [Myxococcota bacterium]